MGKKKSSSGAQATHTEEGGEIVNKNLAKKGYITGSSPVVDAGNIGGPGGSDAKPEKGNQRDSRLSEVKDDDLLDKDTTSSR